MQGNITSFAEKSQGALIRAGVFIRINTVIFLLHSKKGILWDVIGGASLQNKHKLYALVSAYGIMKLQDVFIVKYSQLLISQSQNSFQTTDISK